MRYRTRIKYTAVQRAEIWDRWQRGESMSSIGRVFDRESSSIFGLLSPSGGIRPAERRRSAIALTLSEREEISRGIVGGLSMRAMALQLGRAVSTISREIARNGGIRVYRASMADQAAWDRGIRPKRCKLALHPKDSGEVEHSAGKTFVEDKDTVHWFYNRGDEPASAIVCDIKPET